MRRVLAFALCVALLSAPAAGGEGEVSRRVLGVYNATEADFGEPFDSDIHRFLDKPLNHLGLVVEYVDVNKPLPDFTGCAGIVVWMYDYGFDGPERLLPWLLEAMDAGVKVVLPAGIQSPELPGGENIQNELVEEILSRFGLRSQAGRLGENGDAVRINTLRPEFFGSETEVFAGQAYYPMYTLLNPDAPGTPETEVWLRVERVANADENTVGVVVGKAGGWALSSNFLYYTTDVPGTIYRAAWNISPIGFLERALDLAGTPRPDVTTFWGARGAFSHVDVDGPYNMTQPDVPGPSRYSIEVCAEEIWKKFPYPTTLGLITSEYNPDIDLRFILPGDSIEDSLKREQLSWEKPQREVATELRRVVDTVSDLPWIQFGCHGFSHPLFWRRLTPSYAIRGYEASYEKEIREAVDYLNREVLPPGKKVELFQWTGDCDPPEEALDILADMGMANINGGDPLYDARFDSLYYVCALSVPKGKRRQIYTAGSNENIYSVEWTGYKGAYNHVIETFEKSESPRRLLPVNIYYHCFPAEHLAGYTAIRHAYEWAAKQELCWMTAAEYVAAAEAFFPIRQGRLSGGGWWAEEYGKCPTIRFDNEPRVVDMGASVNVAGYTHHNGSLYVALLPGERAEIRLKDAGAWTGALVLARASGNLRAIEAGEKSWSAEIRQWGPGFVEIWAGEGDWAYRIVSPDGTVAEGDAERLPGGRLSCSVPDALGEWLRVRFEKK